MGIRDLGNGTGDKPRSTIFLGSSPKKELSPEERGEILSVCPYICMSVHLSIHPSLVGPQSPLAGPHTLPAGPQTLLAGPQTSLAGLQTPLAFEPHGRPMNGQRDRQTDRWMDGQMDRIFPYSTVLCPLSGPLRLHNNKEVGQGNC